MRHLERLRQDVLSWARDEDSVRAVLWYGTTALGRWTPYSDLDVALVHDGTAQAVHNSLVRHLGDRVREVAFLPSRNEAALWVDAALTKIDVRLAPSPDGFMGMARAEDVPEPRFVIAIDKDNVCRELAAAAAQHLCRDLSKIVDEEIEKFVVAFEASSNAHRRSDGYRCYFEHNLALHRLARLVEIARGGDVYLFLPRMLLSGRLTLAEQKAFRELHGEIYLPEVAALKRRVVDVFLPIMSELSAKFTLRRDAGQLRHFLHAVLERDLFFNVRDFADAYDGHVRPGVLYRGSALSRWDGSPEFERWVAETSLRRVLDFRAHSEAKGKLAYSQESAERLNVKSLPLSERPDPTSVRRPAGDGYYRDFVAFLPNVAEALRAVGEPAEGAIAVHCFAGKDRTGWFCATVAKLIGMDDELVVDDYLRSGQDTREAAIREFLRRVESGGGAMAHLDSVEFGDKDLRRLRDRLLAGPSECD